MGAERVVFFYAAPVSVQFNRTLVARANAVTPVIFVGKTSTRPANQWHLQLFQRSDYIFAEAIGIGDFGFFADPDTFVNTVAQMFGELSVNVFVDHRTGFIGLNGEIDTGRRGKRTGCEQPHADN